MHTKSLDNVTHQSLQHVFSVKDSILLFIVKTFRTADIQEELQKMLIVNEKIGYGGR